MKRNNWKIGFFASSALLIIISLFSIYYLLDQAVTITHIQKGYGETEKDLKILGEILKQSEMSKDDLESIVSSQDAEIYNKPNENLIHLKRTTFYFESGKVDSVSYIW